VSVNSMLSKRTYYVRNCTSAPELVKLQICEPIRLHIQIQ